MKINLDSKSIIINCGLYNWQQVRWLYNFINMNGEILWGKEEITEKKQAQVLKLVKKEE